MLLNEEKKIKEEENEPAEGYEENNLNDSEEVEASGDTLTPSGEEGTSVPELNNEPEPEQEVAESTDDTSEAEQVEPEKMLTQSQVNALIGEARAKARKQAMEELFERYGVSSDEELNDIFGKGQSYNGLNDDYISQGNSYRDVMAENALLKSRIVPERWSDVKFILGGNGLDVTQENIETLLPSHAEWRGTEGESEAATAPQVLTPEMAEDMKNNVGRDVAAQPDKPATIRKLGNEASPQTYESDDEKALRLFGIKGENR